MSDPRHYMNHLPPMRTVLNSPPFSHQSNILSSTPSPQMAGKQSPQQQPPTLPGIHTLLTPPNSGNTGEVKHSFEAAEPDAIFQSDSAPATTPQSHRTLFPEPHLPPDLELKLEAEEREYIKQWMERKASQWDDWERETGLPRPDENEYRLTWQFYREFAEGENNVPTLKRTLTLTINHHDRQRQQSQPPAQKKRRVLQDTSPNRRGTTSIAPKLPESSTTARTASPKASTLRAPANRKRSAKYTEDDSPEPRSKAARAKATKPETSHNFQDYPDWTPKAIEVPNAMQHAQAVRKFSGGYNDLSNDPHRHMLFPEEIQAAEHLSLNGAKYLCAKRQIFKGYVEHLVAKSRASGQEKPNHNNWNKTAVQQLGNVDVNKMSALFTFFKDVGWFKEHHFKPYVEQVLNNGSSPVPTSATA